MNNGIQTTQTAVPAIPWICIESLILIGLCMADAISTIVFVSLGLAEEYNPAMAFFLNKGTGWFLLAKIVSFLPFVIFCESIRRRDPAKGRTIIRLAIGLYVGFYVVMVALVNLRII